MNIELGKANTVPVFEIFASHSIVSKAPAVISMPTNKTTVRNLLRRSYVVPLKQIRNNTIGFWVSSSVASLLPFATAQAPWLYFTFYCTSLIPKVAIEARRDSYEPQEFTRLSFVNRHKGLETKNPPLKFLPTFNTSTLSSTRSISHTPFCIPHPVKLKSSRVRNIPQPST